MASMKMHQISSPFRRQEKRSLRNIFGPSSKGNNRKWTSLGDFICVSGSLLYFLTVNFNLKHSLNRWCLHCCIHSLWSENLLWYTLHGSYTARNLFAIVVISVLDPYRKVKSLRNRSCHLYGSIVEVKHVMDYGDHGSSFVGLFSIVSFKPSTDWWFLIILFNWS